MENSLLKEKKSNKETSSEYVHQGLAQRSFKKAWTLSDDVEVREVQFKDGLLTVKLGKVERTSCKKKLPIKHQV